MEFFRNAGITKRVVFSTLLVILLPLLVFLYVHVAVPETRLTVLIFLSFIFLFIGLVTAWLIAASIVQPLDRMRQKLAIFVEKRVAPTFKEHANDEMADLAGDLNRLFGAWNHELGSILKRQKARSEDTAMVAAAQSHLESQLQLSRSCLQVAQKLNTTFDFQSNLKTILDEAVKTLNVQWASILLLNRETLELTVACVRGIEKSLLDDLAEDQYPSIRLKPNEGLAGIVIKEGLPLLANKGHRDPRFKAFSEFAARNEKIASLLCAPIKGGDGTVLGVMNFVNRINPPLFRNEDIPFAEDLCQLATLVVERNRLYQNLFTDEGTGLQSHRVWRSYLTEEASRAARYAQPLSVTILDIDRYMELVEKSSPEFALRVSNEIGQIVRKCLRDTDVGSRTQDRFHLLLPNTDAAGAVYLVGRIKEAVEKQSFEHQQAPLGITLSAGIAAFPETTPDCRLLVEQAFAALDSAKAGGRNRAVVFGRSTENPSEPSTESPTESPATSS